MPVKMMLHRSNNLVTRKKTKAISTRRSVCVHKYARALGCVRGREKETESDFIQYINTNVYLTSFIAMIN